MFNKILSVSRAIENNAVTVILILLFLINWSYQVKESKLISMGGITWVNKYAQTAMVVYKFIHPPPLNINYATSND